MSRELATVPDAPRPLQGTIMPPGGAPDFEVASLMERLSRLQNWLVLQCAAQRGNPDLLWASTLVQDTRVLIVERLYGSQRA